MTVAAPLKPLRIAVLEADHPLDGTTAKYGTYGGVFTQLLTDAAQSLSWDPESTLDISKFDVERHQHFPESLDSLDAILISGSRANAFDDTPWIIQLTEYVRNILITQSRVKVVGVCFGHQIIARALGVNIVRSVTGWEASVCALPLNELGMKLFGKQNIKIFQMHKDIVSALPSGASNLGSTDKCMIQGMYEPGRYISIQGHPEFTGEIVREILTLRHSTGIFTDEEYKDMIGRVDDEHDGVLVAKGFLSFVAGN
ncbi:class I glutamine amidotransferase-like protein [Geopyxis carbonaria]|nr:class I glutamine amidotransferase-like protein [Geopyxis carbonaria]